MTWNQPRQAPFPPTRPAPMRPRARGSSARTGYFVWLCCEFFVLSPLGFTLLILDGGGWDVIFFGMFAVPAMFVLNVVLAVIFSFAVKACPNRPVSIAAAVLTTAYVFVFLLLTALYPRLGESEAVPARLLSDPAVPEWLSMGLPNVLLLVLVLLGFARLVEAIVDLVCTRRARKTGVC